jgi:hypothetical protein
MQKSVAPLFFRRSSMLPGSGTIVEHSYRVVLSLGRPLEAVRNHQRFILRAPKCMPEESHLH